MRPKVYRYYAKNDELLYVGMSASLQSRLTAHVNKKYKWFDDVTKITIDSFDSVRSALNAEKTAIVNERPKYNIVNNVTNLPDRGFIGVYELSALLRIPPGRIKIEIQYKRFPITPSETKPFRWSEDIVIQAMDDENVCTKIAAMRDVF